MAVKINWEDKQNIKTNPLPEKNKSTAATWNETKNAVNANADELDALSQEVDVNIVEIQDIKDELVNTVKTIVPGANVAVNSIDPENPIVSASISTSAGILSRLFFTAQETILSAGTFYDTLRNDKGLIGSVQQVVVSNDNTIEYFLQDLISIPALSDDEVPIGTYSGFFSVEANSVAGDAARFGCEIYLADENGNVIDSGVVGNPIGSYGVRVIGLLSSGNVEIPANFETQINVTGVLTSPAPYLAGQRFRYRTFAEKIGTQGGPITFSIYYGFDHNTYIDVPTINTTDNTVNVSKNPGVTTTDALNSLYDKTTPETVIGEWEFLANWDEGGPIPAGKIQNLDGETAGANFGMFFNPIDKNAVDHTTLLNQIKEVPFTLNWFENGVLVHTIINTVTEFYDSIDTEWWLFWLDPPNTGDAFDFGTYPADGVTVKLSIPTNYITEAPSNQYGYVRQNGAWSKGLIPQIQTEGGDNIIREVTNDWLGSGSAVANGIINFDANEWAENLFSSFAFSQNQSGGTSELPFIQTLEGTNITFVDSLDTGNFLIVDKAVLVENPAGTWIVSRFDTENFSFSKGAPALGINVFIGSPIENITKIISSNGTVEISQTDSFNIDLKAVNTLQFSAALSDETTPLAVGRVFSKRVKIPFNLLDYSFDVDVAPTGGPITLDVLKNGVSIWSVKPTIAASGFLSSGGVLLTTPTLYLESDKLEIYVDTVGLTIEGAGLKSDAIGTLIQ